MSDSLDLDQFATLMTNLGNIGKRIDTMASAISHFGAGVSFPADADLSGLNTALTALSSAYNLTYGENTSLIKTLKEATAADESWGDHFKSWLTPPKTGIGIVDSVLSKPASVTAGAVDAAHDFGGGLIALGVDVFDIPGDVSAYRHGTIMPIQRPGYGLITLALHPIAGVKAAVDWKNRNDPTREGTYVALNIFAMIATGGLGEAGEAGVEARLAGIEASGTGEEGEALAHDIQNLEEQERNMPSGRQRNPAKGKWVRSQRASIANDLARARQRLAAIQSDQAERIARLTAARDALHGVRDAPITQAVNAVQTLNVPQIVHRILVGTGETSAIARDIWGGFVGLSTLGDGANDQTVHKQVRDRLREIAAAHAGSS